MKCRICGCQMNEGDKKCEICGVNKFLTAQKEVSPPEQMKAVSRQNKRKAGLRIGISILTVVLLTIIGAILIMKALRPVSEGVWMDGHFEWADAGIQMSLPEEYTRLAGEEKASTTESMICDGIVGTLDKKTQMFLYRIDLIKDSPAAILISKDQYLDVLCKSYENDKSISEFGITRQEDPKNVLIGNVEFTCVSYKGAYTDSMGISHPIFHRMLINKTGGTILFIDIASSVDETSVDNILGLLQSCEKNEF